MGRNILAQVISRIPSNIGVGGGVRRHLPTNFMHAAVIFCGKQESLLYYYHCTIFPLSCIN